MGPARFHCATLLLQAKQYMPAKGSCTATRVMLILHVNVFESRGKLLAERGFDTRTSGLWVPLRWPRCHVPVCALVESNHKLISV